jgi:hypothetical protein
LHPGPAHAIRIKDAVCIQSLAPYTSKSWLGVVTGWMLRAKRQLHPLHRNEPICCKIKTMPGHGSKSDIDKDFGVWREADEGIFDLILDSGNN